MLTPSEMVRITQDYRTNDPMEYGETMLLFKDNAYEFKDYLDDVWAELWWDKETRMTCKVPIAVLKKFK